MRELLVAVTDFVVPLIDFVALIAVIAGTVECVVGADRIACRQHMKSSKDRRQVAVKRLGGGLRCSGK